MQSLNSGLLITIEGVDGSGKSTLASHLYNKLSTDYTTIATREPGGSNLGKQLRSILQSSQSPLAHKAEFLLFAADRAQHFQELIIPSLAAHHIVLSDRMADSSLVYQGFGRGLDSALIKSVNAWVMNNIEPDITFYVRVEADVAQKRLQQRGLTPTVFEQDPTFTQRLINGFDTIFAESKRVYILDGNQAPEIIAQQAYDQVITWIQLKKLQAH